MPDGLSEHTNEITALLWRAFAVVLVVGVLAIVGVGFFVVHDHAPTSHDPVLARASGYGAFVTNSGSALFFNLSCVQSDSTHSRLEPGVWQVPISKLTIDTADSVGGGHPPKVETISLRAFLIQMLGSTFHGYIDATATGTVVTNAPGTTGCAGTITDSGRLT